MAKTWKVARVFSSALIARSLSRARDRDEHWGQIRRTAQLSLGWNALHLRHHADELPVHRAAQRRGDLYGLWLVLLQCAVL